MIESTIALIVALTTALGLCCDKLRQSKIKHCESCCGLFEVDREVSPSTDVVVATEVIQPTLK